VAQPDRITAPIDARRTVVLKGNVHPMAQPRFDLGPVEPAFRIGYITLMLKKTDAQQAALEQLLQQQQDPASPNYHDWLTPEQYADRFGLSQSDLDKISAWLRSEGFTVEYTARGRDWLAFSGTAGQVLATFHTQVHRYRVDGEMHFANATAPSVPASLAPLVAGFMGLDDFYPKPPRHPVPANTSGTGEHTLAPGDLATIYDITKLGLDGTGQTIVIVGQSDVDPTDIQGFRAKYNLPAPNLKTVLYGTDPGTNGSLAEADIDLEWAGAVAPNAALIYVYGLNVGPAEIYAIDNNLAPVISASFGGCESANTSALSSYQSYAQQANSQGITLLASSGDSGAAACDVDVSIATQGLAVNFPASIPEVTAVGGTEFNEGGGTYWNTSNGSTGGSALSYIPEMAWNDTTSGGKFYATGGGASSFFPKPAWQTGLGVPSDNVRDLPDISLDAANNHDPYNVMTGGSMVLEGGTSVSTPVFAGIVALLNQYLVANKVQPNPGVGNINPTLYRLAQSAPSAFHQITVGNNIVPCVLGTPDCGASLEFGYSAGLGYNLATGLGSVDVYNLVTQWNGTSAIGTTTTVTANPTSILTSGSTTLMATVSASTGSATPTGSVSFTLGSTLLGTQNLSGSGAATASLKVNGSQLALGNNSIAASYGYGGATGFGASWGSVTVSVSVPATSTTTTVTANPSSISAGGSTALTATVKAASGSTAPTGSVAFTLGSTSLGVINLSGSGGTATASLTVDASQLTVGNNTITASYSASNGFGASSGSVTVTLSVSTVPSRVVPSVTPNPVFQQAPDADGYSFFYTLRLSEIAGNATTLTGFTFDGADYSSQIQTFFGTASIPANGTIAAQLRAQLGTPPINLAFGFSGTDASGTTWTQQITVPFLAQPSSASMTLASLPATVVPDTTHCTSQYPYYQQLNLQEQNGYEVQLTRFLGGGNDLTSEIASWFGSLRLAPFGSLQGGICWNVPTPPTNLAFEMDGTDTAGNKVTATLLVPFQNPPSNAGALTVSKSSVAMSASPSQSAAATVNVNVPSGQAWTVSAFPASEKSGWLTVFPLSGTGPATVTLVAAAPGLANGVYTTTLVFQSANTAPQFVSVPVTFTIGASSAISIAAVAHGASYQHLYAPGMLVSVFGTNLATSEQLASTLPLPLTMAGVSATVNGIAAPLLYVSPLQLNIQIPYETTTGTALLAVSNNGLVATNSFTVSASAPGLFTQNQQGTGPITATSSGGRGQQFALYVTGAGEVSPPIATGAVPTGTQVPVPLLPVSVTVGGVAANLDYVGLPSWSVGTLQVNFTVPQNAPLGAQPVVVTVGSASSPVAVTFTVQ